MKRIMIPLVMLLLLAMPVFAEVVYQENADAIAYANDTSEGDPSGWWDGNYSTKHMLGGGGNHWYYSNYTKPLLANDSETIWQRKYDSGTLGAYYSWLENHTVPVGCFDADSEVLMLRFYMKGEYANGGCYFWSQCWNSTDWYNINYVNQGGAYCGAFEEAVYWEIAEVLEEAVGYTPVQASILTIVSLVFAISVFLMLSRELLAEFNIETLIGLVLLAVIFIAFMSVIVGLVYV